MPVIFLIVSTETGNVYFKIILLAIVLICFFFATAINIAMKRRNILNDIYNNFFKGNEKQIIFEIPTVNL